MSRMFSSSLVKHFFAGLVSFFIGMILWLLTYFAIDGDLISGNYQNEGIRLTICIACGLVILVKEIKSLRQDSGFSFFQESILGLVTGAGILCGLFCFSAIAKYLITHW